MMDVKAEQLEVKHDLAAPRASRRFVTGVLRRWSVPADVVDSAQLLVSELVSNAVLHGRGPISVLVAPTDVARMFRIEVRNSGIREPVMRHAAPHELSGRGLHIVHELSHDWGTATDNGVTTVWFEMHADAFT
jgi:anti-sigma regulatory factor (Ser/Thr protein kinase)